MTNNPESGRRAFRPRAEACAQVVRSMADGTSLRLTKDHVFLTDVLT
jgi:hypothetical protein